MGLLTLSLILVALAAIAEAALTASYRFAWSNGEADRNPLAWIALRRSFLPGTVLVLRSITIVAVSSFISLQLFRSHGLTLQTLAVSVAFSALVIAMLQALMSSVAAINPEQSLRLVNAPLRLFDIVLRPLTIPLLLLTSAVVKATPQTTKHETTTEEDIQAIVEEIADHEGPLEAEERDMILRIIGLESISVREIMVPRPDIIAAEANAPLSRGIDLIVEHGVSRIPIYEETIDEVVGVVYAKDMLRAAHREEAPASLRALARKPHFVPESKKIDELLKELRANHIHMAIVVDEYGGTAGLVAMEDLLEEIVGEIEDEYDRTETAILQVSPTEAVLDARVSIADLNELFGTEITQDDFATVGGLVYSELGKIPTVGDEVHVEGLTISVLSTSGRRIKKVRAVLVVPTEDDSD